MDVPCFKILLDSQVVVLSDQLDVVVWSLEKIKKKMYRMHVDVI